MVKVVSTRGLPPECRSRELYAPILFDRTDRLTEEERLAVQAAAKREQRKRKKQQEITEIPEEKRMVRSSLRSARMIQKLKNSKKSDG